MGLLIWKILGYGLIIMVGLGVAFSALSAAFTIFLYAATPFLFVTFLVLSAITYPITLCLRASGENYRSFFHTGLDAWQKWHAPAQVEQAARGPDDNQHSKIHGANQERREKSTLNVVKEQFDPWSVLSIERTASKEDISIAYRKKMMGNHPDKVASLDPDFQKFATERTVLIKRAYDELMKQQ